MATTISQNLDSQLSSLGASLLQNLSLLCIDLFLFALYAIVFPPCLVYLSRLSKSRTKIILSVSISLLCIAQSFIISTSLAYYIVQLKTVLRAQTVSVDVFASKFAFLYRINGVGHSLNFIVSDCVFLWRAWALYPQSKIVRSVVAPVAFINTVFLFVNGVIVAVNGRQSANSELLNTISSYSSFIANLVATSVIGYRVWKHQDRLRLKNDPKRAAAWNVLILVIESGLAFVILQLINAILCTPNVQDKIDKTFPSSFVFYHATSISGAVLSTLVLSISTRPVTSVAARTLEAYYPQLPSSAASVEEKRWIQNESHRLKSVMYEESIVSGGISPGNASTRTASPRVGLPTSPRVGLPSFPRVMTPGDDGSTIASRSADTPTRKWDWQF